MKRFKKISQHFRFLSCAVAVCLCTGNALALNATDTLQAESYTGQSGVTTETCREGGQNVTSIQNGDYIFFNNVDFGTSGIQYFEARIASYGPGGFIEVRLDSLAGTLVGTCETRPVTGNWQTWTSRTCKVTGASGIHNVYLKFTGITGTENLFSVNWVKFHRAQSFTTVGWRASSKTARGVWKGTITLVPASGTSNVTIFPDTLYQRVEGHGGAFNETGWHCIDTLNRISSGLGTSIVRELYDPVNGCKFNTGRVPIGMSDFTVNKVYSLDELPSGVTTDYTMQYFTLHNDSIMNMAYVKSAMAFQPNLMVYATPWTPPSWMKSNKNWAGTNSATMDTNSKNLAAYALYFHKFIDVWNANGISIYTVCPQNEPTYATGGHPSCYWPGTGVSMKNFCRDYLCPEFNKNGIATEVWMGTFYETNYAVDMGPTLSDTLARKLIKGCGLQRGGAALTKQAMDTAAKYNLHWHSVQTENWCYSGVNNWNDAMSTYSALFDFWTKNTNSFNFWNMVLDSNYNYVSWMPRAQNAMVIVNPKGKPLPTIMYTGEFYMMKHFSYYVAIGAYRVKTTTSGTGLTSTAFKNPDGSIIVEVMNYNKTTTSAVITLGTQSFTATLPDSSANTFILGGNPDTRNWTPGSTTNVRYTNSKQTALGVSGTIGVYDISGRLVKFLKQSHKSAVSNMVWDWTDASGRKAAPGMYIIINRTGKDVITQKVICK